MAAERRLTDKGIAQARVLCETGTSVARIAKKFDCAHVTISRYADKGKWRSPMAAIRNAPTGAVFQAIEERAQREVLGLDSDDPIEALNAITDERVALMRAHRQDWGGTLSLRKQIFMALNEPSWRPPESWTPPGSRSDSYDGWKHGDKEPPDPHIRQLYVRELTRTFSDLTDALVAYQEGERRAHGFSFIQAIKENEQGETMDADRLAELETLQKNLDEMRAMASMIEKASAPQIEAKPQPQQSTTPVVEWWQEKKS